MQTACRLNRAMLQGYYTALVLCRQPADWTELWYRDIAQHYYTHLSCVLVHACIRKCSTVTVFRLTQHIVAVCQHFAVHKQVTRADLHRWNYHNGAATCMGRAAVRAPEDREHGVEETIISILQAPWNIFSWNV